MDPPKTLPQLEVLQDLSPHSFIQPVKRIHDGQDVDHFLRSKAYRDIGIFILQLNRALCPRKPAANGGDEGFGTSGTASNVAAQTFRLDSKRDDPETVRRLQSVLEKIGTIIEEVPPDPGPRRFGNISFRRWHEVLESRADGLLREHLPAGLAGIRGEHSDSETVTALDELKAYFLGGFGSPQRLDYGTGHELSFVAFLGGLWKLGAFRSDSKDGEIERSVALGIIEP
jgi:serine/threonine-protein phosphatase 2A activator